MRERELFLASLEKPTAAERLAFLDSVCDGEQGLRDRVAVLLREHERQDPFLLDSAPPGLDAPLDEAVAEAPGDRVGPYTLREVIGEGGFSVVFRADQGPAEALPVAVKIIKPGMDSRQVLARFSAEQQVLALMSHPHIAQVQSAGCTASGRPYFAMELVAGLPVTDYCDRHRLPLPERLGLFALVCRAVQHAHQKGIIHRDIKPNNVLVTEVDGRPIPKIIDFGVAKAVDGALLHDSDATRQGQVIGTIEYMSPEQAAGSPDIDTRSDVYSLGALLYELLVGHPPFPSLELRRQSFADIVRVIQEVDPPPPSAALAMQKSLAETAANRRASAHALRQAVRADLDWIVMKAIEKTRTRRYESAGALAADIDCHLHAEPVSAAAPSRLYRWSKFVSRNRWPVVAIAGALVGLVALVIGLTISLRTQARLRSIAERERTQAQLDLAAGLYSRGRLSEAEALYSQALRQDSAAENWQRAAQTQLRLARIAQRRHGDAASEPRFRDAVQAFRHAFPADDPELANALRELGCVLRDGGGSHAEAEQLFRESLAIHRQATPANRAAVAEGLVYLANELCWQQRFAEAAPYYREAIAERQRIAAPGDSSIALIQMELGVALVRLGRLDEAEAMLLESAPPLEANPAWRLYSAAMLASLYAARHRAQPHQGYDQRALEWSTKIHDGYFRVDSPDKPGVDVTSNPP